MTYQEIFDSMEEIELNLEKDENEIDFMMLKMLQGILKSKENNIKTAPKP